eukprot:TRINITY_DN6880_c0_g1_i1.p1 TRINITY_DN6880_c0_g1~~TRINITY_DN6880_c0_g1_i1.p1  ORF type:complete len:549 (-),score=168.19 TRINITY_DN6880_c0_g1_i1:253-1899(-)
MITPTFELTQDDQFVFCKIHVPYVKLSTVDFYLFDQEFKFWAKPYFLRLTFPHNIVEDEHAKAVHDVANGNITVHIPKEEKGQFFENLDMITLLLKKKAAAGGANKAPPLIEVVGSSSTAMDDGSGEGNGGDGDDDGEDGDDLTTESDWEMDQSAPPLAGGDLTGQYPCGFNNGCRGFFSTLQECSLTICDLEKPDTTSPDERRRQRIVGENARFDEEYYMGDFIEPNDFLQEALAFKPDWAIPQTPDVSTPSTTTTSSSSSSSSSPASTSTSTSPVAPSPSPLITLIPSSSTSTTTTTSSSSSSLSEVITPLPSSPVTATLPAAAAAAGAEAGAAEPEATGQVVLPIQRFTKDEQLIMMSLPSKEYLIEDEKSLLLGMVDILFAYAFDHRTTSGDPTCESSWTICKLSPTLSWFDSFQTLKEMMIACVRRALIFPLFRRWDLVQKVLDDVREIFRGGKRRVLRCLLRAKKILDKSETKFYLSRIYVDDYCVWLQSLSVKRITSLSKKLNSFSISKDEVGFNLTELEQEATSLSSAGGSAVEDQEMSG